MNPSFGSGLSAVGFWQGLPRVSSTLVEPAYFGNYLVTVIPILIAGIFYKCNFFSKTKKVMYFLIAISFVALIITFSRAPYVGITLAFLILVIVSLFYNFSSVFPKIIKLFIGLAAGMLFLTIVTGKNIFLIILRRFFSIKIFYDISTLERATMLVTQFNIFKKFPILGVGLGNFGFYFDSFKPDWGYAVAESGTSFFPSQNIYGEVIAETGILGILSFCLILLLVVIIGLKTFKYSKSSFYKATSLGLVSGFVGYMATMFAVGDFYNFPFMWVLMGLIVAQNRIHRNINKNCNKYYSEH
jgi:O-antigen ligase